MNIRIIFIYQHLKVTATAAKFQLLALDLSKELLHLLISFVEPQS